MIRLIAIVIFLVSTLAASAETLVTSAKILEITESGFILTVGTEPLAVESSADTKCWNSMAPANKGAFKVGDSVQVRIKTDSDPPQLREIADSATWKWLDNIRKTVVKATVEKLDSRMLYVKFPDGTRFSYRITEKSDVKLAGKQNSASSDLSVGMTVYIKGRLLPTLDTWVDEITDVAPAAKPTTNSSTSNAAVPTEKKPKPVKLPSTGKLEAAIVADFPKLKMFDILVEGSRTYHISYNQETKYFLDGKPTDRTVLSKKSKCTVTYKRDQYGRLIASKVEIIVDNS